MNQLPNIAAMLRAQQVQALLLTNDAPESIQYATGFGGLEGMVLITAAGKGFVLTDSRYIEAARARLTPLGFAVSVPPQGGPSAPALRALLEGEQITRLAFLAQSMSVQTHQRLTAALPDCTLEPLGEGLTRLRQIKDQDEIACLRQAQRIAEEAFDALLGQIKPGMQEKELAALLEYEMAKRGSERPSFDTILISGTKTSMPHGMPDTKPVAAGEFILVDFGAVVNGYHSDMTRTFALGSATERMRTVYSTVLAAQETGIRMLRAGISCDQPHLAAHQVIRDAGFGDCFGHALGHCVGLEIHESPALSPRAKQHLEPGMVITVEPGIYLPGEFGVRIEDLLLIQPDGAEDLTHTPKKLLIL